VIGIPRFASGFQKKLRSGLRKMATNPFVFLRVLCGLLLKSKRQPAAQRASRLDHVDGASVLAHYRNVALGQQVAQVKQSVHFGRDEGCSRNWLADEEAKVRIGLAGAGVECVDGGER